MVMTEPQHEPGGGEHRQVHVVEHEDLVAEHRQPVEQLRSLLVGDGRDGGLQVGDVRLEGDGDLVAEATLQRASTPCAGTTSRPPRRPDPRAAMPHALGIALDHTVAEEGEPEREERVGQGGEQRRDEREGHERGLVPVAELAHAATSTRWREGGRRARGLRQARTSKTTPSSSSGGEALGLEVEHRAVAPGVPHQLVVGAELHDLAVLEDADPIGVADGREPVGHEDRRAVTGWRRGPARRSRPRPARRAGRSARRGARRPAPSRTAHRARARATRCHCPPERSVPPGYPLASGRVEVGEVRRRRPRRARRAPWRRRRRPAPRCRAGAARSG